MGSLMTHKGKEGPRTSCNFMSQTIQLQPVLSVYMYIHSLVLLPKAKCIASLSDIHYSNITLFLFTVGVGNVRERCILCM